MRSRDRKSKRDRDRDIEGKREREKDKITKGKLLKEFFIHIDMCTRTVYAMSKNSCPF